VSTDSKDTLPTCYRVGTDDWVNSLENRSNVLRGTTFLSIDLKAVVFSSFVETRLSIGGGEALQELLVGLGDTIVDFVSGSPKGIATSGRKIDKLEKGIITWDRLEGYKTSQ